MNKCAQEQLTEQYIDKLIGSVQYHSFNDRVMICCMTLVNGMIVTGESICNGPNISDFGTQMIVSNERAKAKIYELEGYLRKQKLHEAG